MNSRDLYDHAKMERDAFRKRATVKHKEWLELRRQKRWFEALQAKDREIEYRDSARQRQKLMDEIRSANPTQGRQG